MEDKSLYNSQVSKISENLQNYIDSMVEEIVLEGKPFDSQKKYLKKFSENEGVNYDKLESDIHTFIEILNSLKIAFNKLQVKLAEEKGRDCHISEETVQKLINYSSQPQPRKQDQNHTQDAVNIKKNSSFPMPYLYGGIGVLVLAFIVLLFMQMGKGDQESIPQIVLKSDTVVLVKHDTIEKMQVLHDTIVNIQYSTEAERLYRADAERGDADAQFNLGCNYYSGVKGLQQNYSEAVKWYTKAANQGHAGAQNNLGFCYEKGYGVAQSYSEAKKWYKKAIEQGNNKSRDNLKRVEDIEKKAKEPKVVEYKIPAPSWNGKVLSGEFQDKFKLREVKKEGNPGRWNSLSNKEWLKENNLKMEYISYTKNPNGKYEGEKPNIDLGIFPSEYKGRLLKRYEYSGNLCTAFYTDKHWDYNFLLLFDIKKDTLYKIDFTSFSKAPYTKPGDEQFVIQGVRYPHLIDNVLYVQHGHGTYAYSSGNKNAYISAIDLEKQKIIWTTQPLTCNSDFIIIDNTIICGYGFSAEPDYIYLVDLATGKRRQTIKVASAPDNVVRKGNQVYVLTYDTHYVFDIVR